MGHLVQPSCRSRVTYSNLHRTLSRRVLNISREGDSTASLGSLFQCSVTLRGKKFYFVFRRNFLCFSLCPLPLVLSLGTTENSFLILQNQCVVTSLGSSCGTCNYNTKHSCRYTLVNHTENTVFCSPVEDSSTEIDWLVFFCLVVGFLLV